MNLLFISLGCDKNLVDTEKMLGILGKEGYSFVDDENEADIVVVNTCCFIGDAKEESINTILQMAELKKNGRLKALIITGCLAQRYKQEIIDEIPEVDAILGTTSYEAVGAAIREVMDGETPEIFESIDAPVSTATERLITTGGHYAFLKIAEGCTFFLTQPIYTDADVERIRYIKEHVDTRLICGIMPLVSYKNALFVCNEMPGIHITRDIVYRYDKEMTREEAEAVATQISVETAKKLYDVADGFYMMTPFNRAGLISNIITEIRKIGER